MNINDEALIGALMNYASAFTFEHLLSERGLEIKAPDATDIIECDDPDRYHGEAANQALLDAYLTTASIVRTTSADAHVEVLTDITQRLFAALDPADLYPATLRREQMPELAAWLAFVAVAVEVPSEDLLLAGVILERLLRESYRNLREENLAS